MRTRSLTVLALSLLFAASGCVSTGSSGSDASQKTSAEALALWLEAAPQPTVVACSVDAKTAPNAVEQFNAMSKTVAAIYGRVYAEAAEAAAAQPAAPTEITMDAALEAASTALDAAANSLANGNQADTPDWRATAQNAVTAQYQQIIQEINAQSAAVAAFSADLRNDPSIANMTNKISQTLVLGQIGRDSAKLGAQLKQAEEGARLAMRRRIDLTLGK